MTRVSRTLLVVLIVLAPLGTRWIIDVARLGDATVESATHGVFLTELLALAVVAAVLLPLRGASALRLDAPGKLAVALLALSSFSAAISSDPFGSSATVVRLAVGVALFVAVSRARLSVRTAAWALLFMAALQATFGLAQFAAQSVPANTVLGVAAQSAAASGTSVVETAQGRWLRAYGTLPHPNVLGLVTAAGTLAGLWLVADLSAPAVAASLTALAAAGMFFSFSRGAVLAFVFGAAFLFVDAVRTRGRLYRYLLGALLVACVALFAVALVPGAWLARAAAQGRLETISVDARARSLADGAALMADAPLLGVGPGLMPYALAAKYPGRDGWAQQPAHAVPLLVGAEVGVPGMLVWLLFMGTLLYAAWRERRTFSLAPCAAVLLAVLVASFFDHYFWTTWPGQLMFWTFCGLFWGQVRLIRDDRRASTASS